MDRCLPYSLTLLAALALGACDDEGDRSPTPELGDTEWDDSSNLSDGDDGDDGDGDDSRGDDSSGADDDDDNDSGDDPDDPSDDSSDAGNDSRGDSDTDDSDSGDSGDSTPPPAGTCEASTLNLAGSGFVSASSVFDTFFGPPYPAELSIDGDPGTSWFSRGPEVDGDTSTFEWYVMRDHCIDEITIHGNGSHENPDFHEMFGFGSVTVTLYDTSGDAVLSRDLELEGTPDPTVTVDAEGVLAHRLVLEFHDHESPDCGGFTELDITGRAKKSE